MGVAVEHAHIRVKRQSGTPEGAVYDQGQCQMLQSATEIPGRSEAAKEMRPQD